MIRKLSLAAGLVLAAATMGPIGASAAMAPQSPIAGTLATGGSFVQKAQWRYCGGWRRECAARWGWRTPGFFRCMGRHGC
jgi:hypothetical protein